jgi:DNA (cytosine-5)-methyltransferase 1
MKVDIFSFFSGAGFLDLGFEHSGFHVSLVNEVCASFMKAYKYSRQQMNVDITACDFRLESIEVFLESKGSGELTQTLFQSRDKGSITGFIGGPPCPDFSVGGKNKGKDGSNGSLSKSYVDLICQQQPDFFLFENVKGLWKTTKHRQFYEQLKSQLQESGYILYDKLINTLDYGVPQHRERIILMGFCVNSNKRFLEMPFVWPEKNLQTSIIEWPTKQIFQEGSVVEIPSNLPINLTVEYWFQKNKVDFHPNATHYFKPRAGLSKFQSIDEGDDCKKSYKRLHRWRFSPTACYGNNEVHLHPL